MYLFLMMLDDIFLFFTICLVLCVSNLYVKLSVLPFWPGLPGRRYLYLNGTFPGKGNNNQIYSNKKHFKL